MAKFTWVGDGDPSAQIIHMGDLRFIRNEARDVPQDHPFSEMIVHNPMFVITDTDTGPVDDRDIITAELDAAGIKYDGRMKTDNLRELLAKG